MRPPPNKLTPLISSRTPAERRGQMLELASSRAPLSEQLGRLFPRPRRASKESDKGKSNSDQLTYHANQAPFQILQRVLYHPDQLKIVLGWLISEVVGIEHKTFF